MSHVNRRDCVANIRGWKTASVKDALASHIRHRREQRTVRFRCHRRARLLPERLERTVPRRRRHRPARRKLLFLSQIQLNPTFSQGIVFSLIVLQIRFHMVSTASSRSDGQPSSHGGTWQRPPARPPVADDPEYPMQTIRMAVHVTKQTHTHAGTPTDRDSSSEDRVEKATFL